MKMDEIVGIPLALHSNASLNVFPNNNASCFRVRMPIPMRLTEKWVVGFGEGHFSLNIALPGSDDSVVKGKKRAADPAMPHSELKRALPSVNQVYESITDIRGDPDTFIYKVNDDGSSNVQSEREAERERLLRIEFEKWKADKLSLLKGLDQCEEQRVGDLEKYQNKIHNLTVEKEVLIKAKEREVAEKDVQLKAKERQVAEFKSKAEYWERNFVNIAQLVYKDANQMNNVHIPKYLYIYCDIVKLNLIGDKYANFLHVVRVPPISINGDTCRERNDFPTYRRLAHYNFDEIEIQIRDEHGQLVKFEKDAQTLITLHFKCIRC